MLRPVNALFRDHAFWAALGAGTVVSLVAFALRRTRDRFEIGSGGVATLATLIGFAATDRASVRLVAALALLVLGGALTGQRGFGWRAVAAVPGAIVVWSAVPAATPSWIRVAAGAGTAVLAPLFVELDRLHPRLTALLATITAGGVYGTAPDTEHARALVGGTLAAAPLGADPRAAAGSAGAASLAGLVAWTAAVDGQGRAGAVVGAMACAGVFALAPVVRWFRARTIVVVGVHIGVVLVASRVAGLEQGGGAAGAIVVLAYAGAVAILAAARSTRARRV
jgi:hypothetical protein